MNPVIHALSNLSLARFTLLPEYWNVVPLFIKESSTNAASGGSKFHPVSSSTARNVITVAPTPSIMPSGARLCIAESSNELDAATGQPSLKHTQTRSKLSGSLKATICLIAASVFWIVFRATHMHGAGVRPPPACTVSKRMNALSCFWQRGCIQLAAHCFTAEFSYLQNRQFPLVAALTLAAVRARARAYRRDRQTDGQTVGHRAVL